MLALAFYGGGFALWKLAIRWVHVHRHERLVVSHRRGGLQFFLLVLAPYECRVLLLPLLLGV